MEAMEAVLFYIFAALAAASALGCVLARDVVRMAVCLFATLGAVAMLYFLMAASFLAAIQLIVYVGGTLIVIIFGVMLTSQSPEARFAPKPVEIVAGTLVCAALFGGLTLVLTQADWGRGVTSATAYSVATIGESLLTTYLLPFELVSVLLLAVMIAAAYLARRERTAGQHQTDT